MMSLLNWGLFFLSRSTCVKSRIVYDIKNLTNVPLFSLLISIQYYVIYDISRGCSAFIIYIMMFWCLHMQNICHMTQPYNICLIKQPLTITVIKTSVGEKRRPCQTVPMDRPKCLMGDFTNLYGIYKAHQKNVWWTMKFSAYTARQLT